MSPAVSEGEGKPMFPKRVNSSRRSHRPDRAQNYQRASRQRPRTTRRFLRFSLGATLAACLCLAWQSAVLATLILDANDPAFNNAILEPFDPSNAAPGATSF